jgi:methionyl-tRNA formyltransferase
MRVVFLGTPAFAVPTLKALYDRYEIVAVVCQPDRERDRKGNYIDGAVKSAAKELNLPVYQFEKIKTDGVSILRDLRPDVMITCAYGQILSQEILDIAPLGVINVHGSILPKYRGAAPIQRAVMDGEKETGVTIMKTDVGMDSGDILSVEKVEISDEDYAQDLFDKLSFVGAELLVDTLDKYAKGEIKPIKQDESKVTYASMIEKSEAQLDFSLPAEKIRNIVRGVGYGVFSYKGLQIKAYRLCVVNESGNPGEILAASKGKFIVACGEKALAFTELQASGKKRMGVVDFLNGVKLTPSDKLD